MRRKKGEEFCCDNKWEKEPKGDGGGAALVAHQRHAVVWLFEVGSVCVTPAVGSVGACVCVGGCPSATAPPKIEHKQAGGGGSHEQLVTRFDYSSSECS